MIVMRFCRGCEEVAAVMLQSNFMDISVIHQKNVDLDAKFCIQLFSHFTLCHSVANTGRKPAEMWHVAWFWVEQDPSMAHKISNNGNYYLVRVQVITTWHSLQLLFKRLRENYGGVNFL